MRHIPLDAITDAAQHVYKAAVRTPLIKLDLPTMAGGPEVYLKLESLQPIGSFKIRGAWNAVRKLTPEQLKDGVWTVSAGNAAQGVALAAKLAGVPCSVMMIETAPQTKFDAVARLVPVVQIVPEGLDRVIGRHREVGGSRSGPPDPAAGRTGRGRAGLLAAGVLGTPRAPVAAPGFR